MAHCVFLAARNSTNTLFSGENEKRHPAGVRILRQSEDSIQYSELFYILSHFTDSAPRKKNINMCLLLEQNRCMLNGTQNIAKLSYSICQYLLHKHDNDLFGNNYSQLFGA